MSQRTFEIIETSSFAKRVQELLPDDEYRTLQNFLVLKPDAGVLIPGSGGLRKLRWTLKKRGKRGGLRIIYYLLADNEQILMIYIYVKTRQSDLSKKQIKMLRQYVEDFFYEK